MMDQLRRILAAAVVPCLAFIPAGLLFIGMGYRDLSYARESSQWPTVEAVITESSSRSDRGDFPKIAYTYSYGGRAREGSRIDFGVDVEDEIHAREMTSLYPKGTHVLVSVSPTEPNVSVLRPGPTPRTYLGLEIGFGILALAGITLAAHLITTGRENPRAETAT